MPGTSRILKWERVGPEISIFRTSALKFREPLTCEESVDPCDGTLMPKSMVALFSSTKLCLAISLATNLFDDICEVFSGEAGKRSLQCVISSQTGLVRLAVEQIEYARFNRHFDQIGCSVCPSGDDARRKASAETSCYGKRNVGQAL